MTDQDWHRYGLTHVAVGFGLTPRDGPTVRGAFRAAREWRRRPCRRTIDPVPFEAPAIRGRQ